VLESFEKERYCSLPKKRKCEDSLRKKVSRRSKSSRKGKGSEEVHLMVGRAQKVGHGACCW